MLDLAAVLEETLWPWQRSVSKCIRSMLLSNLLKYVSDREAFARTLNYSLAVLSSGSLGLRLLIATFSDRIRIQLYDCLQVLRFRFANITSPLYILYLICNAAYYYPDYQRISVIIVSRL